MEKSFFFNSETVSGVPDRTYTAEDIAEREACLISDGVMSGDALMVTGALTTGVNVASGAAMISGYTYVNTETKLITVTPPVGTYSRVDLICLKLDMSLRQIYLTSYSGTPAAEPTAPVIENTETVKILPLAEVTVAPGATSIASSDISDRRELGGLQSEKANLRLMLREYLGEIDPLNKLEISRLRYVSGIVSGNAGSERVLCGDGTYRKPATLRRVTAKEYTENGEYSFSCAEYPSVGNMYDIEVQGAGGGGGSHNGTDCRGGGGGGGAYLCVSGTVLRDDTHKIIVGKGGVGVPGGSGSDGGESRFDGFVAAGGTGGGGGSAASGGAGGTGTMCIGGNGAAGIPSATGEFYESSGAGGCSHFGDGANGVSGVGATDGIAAVNPGAGGSGASSEIGTFGKIGGAGCDGAVIVYRYVSEPFDDEEESV